MVSVGGRDGSLMLHGSNIYANTCTHKSTLTCSLALFFWIRREEGRELQVGRGNVLSTRSRELTALRGLRHPLQSCTDFSDKLAPPSVNELPKRQLLPTRNSQSPTAPAPSLRPFSPAPVAPASQSICSNVISNSTCE